MAKKRAQPQVHKAFRLPVDLYNRAEDRAEELNIDFSELTRIAIREFLEDAKEESTPETIDGIVPFVGNAQATDSDWFSLPCYGVAAGSPISGDEFEVKLKENYNADHFALKVFGDSMAPEIKDGQTVVIRKPESLNNPHVKKGEIYCFLIKGERTLKRYNTRPATQDEVDEGLSYDSPRGGGKRVKILESINPIYPEIVIREGDDPQILGWYDRKNQPSPIDIDASPPPSSATPSREYGLPPGKSTPYAPYIRTGESSEEFSERFRNENTPEEAALIWSVPVERAAKLLKYKVIPDDVFLSIEQIMEEQQCDAETAMKFFLNYRAFKSKKKKSASAALSKALAK
ncbi:MAG: S24 family peptidase [Verrucomicrobiota bacterium]